jgi:colicin import membrane protein
MQTEQAVTCKYPGCENEPRAADDGAGAKPKYCGQPDPLTGKPHTALTAFRRRQELTRQGGAAEAEDLGRPVTMATARAAELRNGIRADMTALTGKLTELAAQLDRAADPEAAAAQVEAVQAEAAQQVADAQAEAAREAQRRQQAEADAEEARSAAVEMDGKLQAAETARGQAEQRAANARADAEQARSEAAARIEQARAAADTQVSVSGAGGDRARSRRCCRPRPRR